MHVRKAYIATTIIFSCSQQICISQMIIYEHHIPTWASTDNAIYASLKERPLNQSVTCLVTAWANLIHEKKLNLAQNIPYLNGASFTVCSHEHYTKIVPLLKRIGITHLFTTQAAPDECYGNIKVLPTLYMRPIKHMPLCKKDILYSFIGYQSHKVRKALFHLPTKADVVIKKRKKWQDGYREKDALFQEYITVMARSRFGLCPRGNSPNTIRFTELLQAGTIPVVIADDLYLPEGIDWDQCVIRVKEKDIALIDSIIRAIPLEQEERMRKACLEAFNIVNNDPAFFIRYYFDTYPL